MIKIYLIEDIHGLKYVGSTKKEKIISRLYDHRAEKKKQRKNTTSHKLDLYNCEISILEECDDDIRYEREKYWINNIDCVNETKFKYSRKEIKSYLKEYYQKNYSKWTNNFNYLLRIEPDIFFYEI